MTKKFLPVYPSYSGLDIRLSSVEAQPEWAKKLIRWVYTESILNYRSIFILIITFLLFLPAFNLFFVQDDFFLLATSKANNLIDFFKLFLPQPGVIWYRPLSSQIFFFFSRLIFGLNPLPYHLIMFATHVLNIFLIYFLTKIVTKNYIMAMFASFIYATSSIHFITLAWLATYSFILGPTFTLLTLLFYFKKKYLYSVFFYAFGLLTSEVVLFTFIPLVIIEIIFHKTTKLKTIIRRLSSFIILLFILLVLRKFIYPVQYKEAYSLNFNLLSIISLFKFYLYRCIGIPMLIRVMPGLFNKIIILVCLGVIVFLSIILPIFRTIPFKHKKIILGKEIVFSGVLYFSFLVLFLFLPNHYSPYYLTFAFIGASLYVGIIMFNYNKSVRFIFVICYILLQYLSVQSTYKTHWIVSRAKLAQQLIKEKKLIHPIGSEEYFSLGAGKAADVFNN